MKPGMRENECVGLVNKVLYDLGSEYVEGVNAISGERCSPHPHVFSDRVLRPGDPAYLRHPAQLHGLPHLLLPDLRHWQRVARAWWMPTNAAAITWTQPSTLVKPGRHHRRDRLSCGRRPRISASPNEEAAFALQYGHGVGLAIWEKPIFSRLVSLDHPEVIEEGMVFALEDLLAGFGRLVGGAHRGAVVVTKDGCEVMTRFSRRGS